MIVRRTIFPPYLQFFISDISRPENPTPDVEAIRILFNGRCISVPCAYYEEAGTELVIGTPDEVVETATPEFDDVIPTPGKMVLFDDAEGTEWIVYPVPTLKRVASYPPRSGIIFDCPAAPHPALRATFSP